MSHLASAPFRTGCVMTCLLFLATSCGKSREQGGEGKGPAAAAHRVGDDGAMHPDAADRCPVCGMTVHDRKFPAAISRKDGRTYYFCGPGCLIRAWTDPTTHLGVPRTDLQSARATDYFTGKSVDANNATWIFGSDVKGPMGRMPVVLSDAAAVKAFMERHGGTTLFRLKDMTADKWKALREQAAP